MNVNCFKMLMIGGALYVGGCFPNNEEPGNEVDFVKKSAIENDPYTPCGVAIDRASLMTTWGLHESPTGLKFVEVEGELMGGAKQYVIDKYHPEKDGSKAEFCEMIPAVTNFFAQAEAYKDLGSSAQARKMWDAVCSWIRNGSTTDNYDPVFVAAAQALVRELNDHSRSAVHFRTQFLLPVPDYEYNNGKLIRSNIKSYKEGYSEIKFDKGPFAGKELRVSISTIIKNAK